jgi:hypothetical protein
MSSTEENELKGGHPPAGKYFFYIIIGTDFQVILTMKTPVLFYSLWLTQL